MLLPNEPPKPTVYIETSIISYLTARLSRDIVMLANQQLTRDWWDNHRSEYGLYISQYVLDEAGAGDPQAAQKRLQALNELPLLPITVEAGALAQALVHPGPLPSRAGVDALHMAVATVSGIDYLLTWNCKHIVNPIMRRRVENICREHGYQPPTLCTPYELLGIGPSDEETDLAG